MTPLHIQHEICRLYPTTRTDLLAETYGVSTVTITNIVKRHGGVVKTRHTGNHISDPWTPEEDAIIKEHFATDSNIRAVMPRLPGRTYNAIRSRANRYLDCKMKKLPEHDESFFDVPNEVNCSWAGFIAADGCISDISRLSLRLATKDRAHLENFVKAINFTGKIYDYKSSYTNLTPKRQGKDPKSYSGEIQTSTIQVQCPVLCAKLKEYWNITPRKTYTLEPPNLTDNRLIMAFISGLIDGDGFIIKDESAKYPQYHIGVMGTAQLIQWVKQTFDRLVPNSDESECHPTGSDNIVDYKVSGIKSYWLAKMFLSLDLPRLNRKWDKLREFVTMMESGQVSQRAQTTTIRYCPSPNVLEEFGLTADRDRFFATIRPSVL